jgi:hypothetical protein
MKRRHRILVSLAVILGSTGLVMLLVLLGSAVEGPVGATLGRVGDAVRTIEARAAHHVRGPGRAHTLAWLAPLRTDASALRGPDRLLVGAYDSDLPRSLEGVLRVEQVLGTTLPLIQIYTAWGDRADQRFPLRLAQAISDIGSIPVITWEPWLTDFENRLHPGLPLRDARDRGGLAAIAAGTYDFYIDEWARAAARFERPLLLRFAHEMNDPYRYPWGPQNNAASDFVAAWQRVVQRFRDAGAHNVVWVWAPHIAYAGYEAYYPGDDVVDWTGTGVLNYGTVANWSQWWSFDEIFSQRYDGLARYGKPVMLAEVGSLAVGGDRAAWFAEALTDLPTRLPLVKALLFFHVAADQTITYQALDWSFASDTATAIAIRKAVDGW